MYAVGDEHPHREPCRAILRRAEAGELTGEASPDLVQEFLHQRVRKTGDQPGSAALARDVARLCRFHDLTEVDVLQAIELFERHGRLSPRDAVFVAFALNHDIDAILSLDRAFDEIPGLERIDPSDAAGVDALAR